MEGSNRRRGELFQDALGKTSTFNIMKEVLTVGTGWPQMAC